LIKAHCHRAPLAILSIGLMLSGCDSLRAYEGPRRPRSELAHIVGDSRVSAGAPLAIILRRVDELDVGLRYNSVLVSPGAHTLLIDCTVTESKHTSRHHLDVDVDAGVKYRLVADTARGNRECAAVQLVSVN
jgi:hypothetical protein